MKRQLSNMDEYNTNIHLSSLTPMDPPWPDSYHRGRAVHLTRPVCEGMHITLNVRLNHVVERKSCHIFLEIHDKFNI